MKLGIGNLIQIQFGRGKNIPETKSTPLPGEKQASTERGSRATPENSLKYMYREMWVDPELRSSILDIRRMDREDGRVKKLHNRMARTAVKGGLKLKTSSQNKKIIRLWKQFRDRLHLKNQQKLESDARGLVMEGNLPLQVVVGQLQIVSAVVRMPSETILPLVDPNGQFRDVKHAYDQIDLTTGQPMAAFALWQLQLARLDPDSFDDMGALGRPYLDANREVWKKLRMTETDLVIRRRHRAPLRLSHILDGASEEELTQYKDRVESEKDQITTDFYSNKKGGVSAVQGDAALDQIADVSYLLDTFYAGAPAPKGLFGYTGELARDILEDLKRDYFEEIDAIQDIQSSLYDQIFRLDLLLQGVNPENYDFEVIFSERRTDTPNQRADLALKHKAIGIPDEMIWETAGLSASEVMNQRKAEANSNDPYPEESAHGSQQVKITPGNQPKGESATSVNNG